VSEPTTMDGAIHKAESLIEAGGYIRKFRDRFTVIKLGGNAMEDPVGLEATLQDVVFMETVGLRPILVHGGGRAIDRAMAAAGLTPRKIQGRRVTDDAALEIVVRILTQESEGLVEQIRLLGGQALPLFDRSLQCLFGERLTLPGADGRPIDLGHVGQVTRVNAPLLESLGQGGVVPVIPSLAQTSEGRWLNVNADTAAAALAVSVGAEKLVVLTDVEGLYADWDGSTGELVSELTVAELRALLRDLGGGMVPKMQACLDAVDGGVPAAHVLDGRVPHALLLEVFTDSGVGTMVTP